MSDEQIRHAAELSEELLTQDLRNGIATACSATALGALRTALQKPLWTAEDWKQR